MIAAIVYLPVKFKLWVHDKMLCRETAIPTIEQTYRDRYRWLGPRLKKTLIRWISKPVCAAINSLNTIPVSRTNTIAMIDTISDSVKALREGYNVLIFPEKPGQRYDENAYREMHPAYSIIGMQYYAQSGKELSFYPVFADKRHRRFSIGEPVQYQPESDPHDEAMRIVSEVQSRMIRLSEEFNNQNR